jgi:acyl carrier protein
MEGGALKPSTAYSTTQPAVATVDQVLQRLAEALDVEVTEIDLSTRAGDLENWDSMGTMSVQFMLDVQFDVKLQPNQTDHLRSVQGILELLRQCGKVA